jgi:hypothetical protein
MPDRDRRRPAQHFTREGTTNGRDADNCRGLECPDRSCKLANWSVRVRVRQLVLGKVATIFHDEPMRIKQPVALACLGRRNTRSKIPVAASPAPRKSSLTT